ncbi:MAG: hypothetical protein QOK14_487, partial [Frankiaceae bacterium]|nr:hypothetical protein [Frankiaceae bacterium]
TRVPGVPTTPVPVPPVRTSVAHTRPQRCPELDHMTLDRLRAYRRTLLDEELRASYWRRLVQGRRDLLRADSQPGDHDAVRRVLTEERALGGRQVVLMLHPDGGMPILPKLPELWASGVDELDDAERASLFAGLANAESVLSSYREALHTRLDRATADLVARYHEDPRLCLVALPSAG